MNGNYQAWGLWEFLVFAIIIVIIILVLMQWSYNKSLFAPSNLITPLNECDYQNLYIGTQTETVRTTKTTTEDSINVWFFNNYSGAKVIVFFHGNSGNISNRDYVIDICKAFKLNLLLVDYRGYGQSDAQPNLGYLPQDGEIAYRFIRKYFKPKDIVIWGESLGGAVATYVAAKNKCRCLILLSTFSSLSDVVEYYKEIGSFPKKTIKAFIALTGNELNSKEWIEFVKAPVLQIHSIEDDLIDMKSAKLLFNNVKSARKFIQIKGAHSKPQITSKQLKEVFDFVGVRSKVDLRGLTQRLEKVAKEHQWG